MYVRRGGGVLRDISIFKIKAKTINMYRGVQRIIIKYGRGFREKNMYVRSGGCQ